MRKNKTFQLLMGSQLFSVLGTTILQFVISLYVLDITHSSFLFGMMVSLSMVGRLLCLPFSGILADRLPKKQLMLTMDILYMVLAIALLAASQLAKPLTLLAVLTLILGMISAFETPVVQSAIPLVCSQEELPKANGMISSINMLGNIVGPVLAGILYRFDTVYQVFVLCGLLFLVAIFCECLLTIPFVEQHSKGQKMTKIVTGDLKEIIHYLKQKRVILRICFVAFLLNFFVSSFIQVSIPYIARVQLTVNNEQFGLMNTLFAVGSFIGTLVYSAFSTRFSNQAITKSLFVTSCLFGLLIVPFGFITNKTVAFWLMVLLISLIMCIFTMVSVQLMVAIQLMAKQALLGRIMSFIMVISTLAMPLGQLIYGGIGNILTKNKLLFLVIALAIITGVIACYSKQLFVKVKKETTQMLTE